MKYTEEELDRFYIYPNNNYVEDVEYCSSCKKHVPVIREEYCMESQTTKTTTCSICENRIETDVS